MYGLCLNIYPNKSASDFLGQCAIHGIHMASMASSSPKRNPYLVNSDWIGQTWLVRKNLPEIFMVIVWCKIWCKIPLITILSYFQSWFVVYRPLWKMMEFISWDDEIPNWMENHKIHVPNQQPVNDDVNHLPISWDCDFLIHSQTVVESWKLGATEWVFLYK